MKVHWEKERVKFKGGMGRKGTRLCASMASKRSANRESGKSHIMFGLALLQLLIWKQHKASEKRTNNLGTI